MVKINQSFALKPVKTLLFKKLGEGENINADLGEIEWDQVARAMGAHGERVADPAGLRPAIERSRSSTPGAASTYSSRTRASATAASSPTPRWRSSAASST